MAATSPNFTPKRKRDQELWLSPIQFSFCLDTSSKDIPEDGSSSPRSRVAHKFRGLALESGGGATSSEDKDDDDDGEDSDARDAENIRKRMRLDVVMQDVSPPLEQVAAPESVPLAPTESLSNTSSPPGVAREREEDKPPVPPKPVVPNGSAGIGSLKHSYPSINRLSDSRSRIKKRTGSPPLRMKRPARRPFDDPDEEEMEIVDPVRAALTWHEDEITIYDPEDEDDDGTGINGIGFKPTPALAQARATKRRQQLAEYRKREENEARARRNQRRRRDPAISSRSEDKSSSRKVRFTDGEANNIAITTG